MRWLRRALRIYSPSAELLRSFTEYQQLVDAKSRQSAAERAVIAEEITTPLRSGVL